MRISICPISFVWWTRFDDDGWEWWEMGSRCGLRGLKGSLKRSDELSPFVF